MLDEIKNNREKDYAQAAFPGAAHAVWIPQTPSRRSAVRARERPPLPNKAFILKRAFLLLQGNLRESDALSGFLRLLLLQNRLQQVRA